MVERPHVVVVGGGISGLAAAWFVTRERRDTVRITVLEGADQIGGKLRVSDLEGLPLDEGAEAMLARRPEAVALARAVGLGGDLVHPAQAGAQLWSRGRMQPLPSGQIMGIPYDLRALAASGVLSGRGLLRVPLDYVLPRTEVDGDVSIGRYVAARLGREVVDRLVEPLLGGVYAGHANKLSFDATVPQVAAAARVERSLLDAVSRSVPARPSRSRSITEVAPVFASLRGGLGRLPAAVAAAASPSTDVRTQARVRELRRTPEGWALVVGSAHSPEQLTADAVVLAVPPTPASRLLGHDVPAAAVELGGIECASVALVTYVFPRKALQRVPRGTGFLVPPVDRRIIKGATFFSAKWGWLDAASDDLVAVRCSVGRYGETAELQRDDADLARAVLDDLCEAVPIEGAPVAWRVTRWGGALPQYTVGHLGRVARIRAEVAAHPGLAVCGAAYDGVGIAACVASAETAAKQMLRGLEARSR